MLRHQNKRLYSLATDGDARRRRALISITLSSTPTVGSKLHQRLKDLPLFNLRCGKNEETSDFDWKHNLKRLRNTDVRAKGFAINGTNITAATLKAHLITDGMSEIAANSLLVPNDKQDVVLMMKLLHAVAQLTPPTPSMSPAFQETRRALRLIGRLYHSLLTVYTDINLSLHEQLVYLSTAAHLLLAIYHIDKGNFIPVQTFHDLQASIKNVYFCVAKAKDDNPNGKFYVILLGTDGLEKIFGKVRTMVGNDTNTDVLQLENRIYGAVTCVKILEIHPEWGGQERRLTVKPLFQESTEIRSTHDHVNPRAWRGDVFLRNVDVLECWNLGFHRAEEHLADARFPSPLRMMRESDGFDILCPFGNGKMVLVDGLMADERNETEEEVESVAVPEASENERLQADVPAAELHPDFDDIANAEASAMDADIITPSPSDDPNHFPESNAIALAGAVPDPWISIGEDRGPGTKGKKVHKASVLRLYSCPLGVADSKDCLRCVRGYSQYNESVDKAPLHPILPSLLSSSSQAPEQNICVLDPALTIVQCDERLFLAAFQITGIYHAQHSVQTLPARFLGEPNVHINGQVMKLALIRHEGALSSEQPDWEWNGAFEAQGVFRDLDGRAVELINPDISPASCGRNKGASTYIFRTAELRAVSALLYERMASEVHRLPSVSVSTSYPYRSETGACL